MIKITTSLKEEYKIKNLCLAGGVALNCLANGKILEKNIFDNIWIQPAAGDARGSLSAVLAFWHNEKNQVREVKKNDSMNGSLLGPKFSEYEILETLKNYGAKFERYDFEEIFI